MSRLPIWNEKRSWEESEKLWEEGAQKAAREVPIKKLTILPKMPGITTDTAKFLKWKAFRYLLAPSRGKNLWRLVLKHPLRYGARYLKSLLLKTTYQRENDFFFYGISSQKEFLQQLPHSLVVVGFSYCQKPFECPSGRFTDQCHANADDPVCRQCDIGKVLHALPSQKIIPLSIPTVHYIGEKLFELRHRHPKENLLFLITACELTLEMFSQWACVVGIKGIGIRLDGRICNTMKAFELSEEGIKPGLTVLKEETQSSLLDLIRQWRSQ